MKESVKDLLVKILLKKAKGYVVKETTDEYTVDADGEKKLIKSKVVTKRAPPDVTACKILLETESDDVDVTEMTDEQLRAERDRLIGLLANCTDDNSTE